MISMMLLDIIDLSSNEDHIATQPHAKLLDRPAVFVLANEGRQDGQPAFVSAGEGSQEATESGNASLAATSPSLMEKVPLDIAESQKWPSPPTSAPLASIFFYLSHFNSSVVYLSCKQSTSNMHCGKFIQS
jgi:hypothetical protein